MNGFEPVLPLLLAIVFGAAIGVEREWHHKTAGIKTNTLVALGAAGFSMLSAHGFGPSSNPAQLAASVVTGIGFIGAGVIIHRGASVQGVNTAATLWANASMGIAAGSGHYAVAVTIVLAVLFAQISATALSRGINRLKSPDGFVERFEIRVTRARQSQPAIDETWMEFARTSGASVERRTVSLDVWTVVFTSKLRSIDAAEIERRIFAIDGVSSVDILRGAPEPGEAYAEW
jgi:putative Mg2+ transporter-C (MgtC) family protein